MSPPVRSPRRRHPALVPALGLAAAVLAAFLAGYLVGSRRTAERPPAPAPSPEAVPGAQRERPRAAEARPGQGARVALVIDDLGRSLEELDRIGSLGVPVSYAVLPFETRTAEVAHELGRREAEILCHLPMEPGGGANPGPGALTLNMGRRELEAAVRAALERVPGAVGVNNHMGSRFTADTGAMRAVLGIVSGEGLYFLDSRTSAESVGLELARQLGIPAAERRVFLDGDPSRRAVRQEFRRLLALARSEGSAIAIGHPRPETLDVLAEEVPRAQRLGYAFVTVGRLVGG